MSNKILVIGKASYTIKIAISSDLTASIFKENIRNKSIARDSVRLFDGMAANIAYGLSFFDCIPVFVSQVGRDFDCFYRPHLEKQGIILRLFFDQEKETACSFIIEDDNKYFLFIEQDNSYRFIAEKDLQKEFKPHELEEFTVAFIGTGKAEADIKFISFLHEQKKNLPLVYSLDNNVDQLSKWRLSQIFEKITVFICNEDELKQIEDQMKQSSIELIASSRRLKYIISIINRSQIVIHSSKKKIKITEGPAEKIFSNNYWQDAFRAGVIYGISKKKPIDEAAKLGSSLASYSVEYCENQKYSPSLEQILLRSYDVKSVSKIN